MDQTYSEQYLDLWHHHWWWRVRHRFVLHHLESLAQAHMRRPGAEGPLRILDVGCCGGVAFDDWSRFGEVWGIEPDERLAASTPKWSSRVTCSTLEEFQAPEERFDLIILLDVLEHLEDDRGALRGLRDLLVPTGALLLTVPAFPLLWSQHDVVNAHFRRYRYRELKSRIEEAGFEPSQVNFFFGWTFAPLLLRRLVARKQRPYRVSVPPAPINRLLERCCRVEQWLFSSFRLSPPVGSSLLAMAERIDR
ncbi:MAG: class I SAM-dependent methyltransferase [Acidobacteriota bacterium]|nr:class I SAM-dependent methyltransferase [Acidobacteriota bacterium]